MDGSRDVSVIPPPPRIECGLVPFADQGPLYASKSIAGHFGAFAACQRCGADRQRPGYGPLCPAILKYSYSHIYCPPPAFSLWVLEFPADGSPLGSALEHIPWFRPEAKGRPAPSRTRTLGPENTGWSSGGMGERSALSSRILQTICFCGRSSYFLTMKSSLCWHWENWPQSWRCGHWLGIGFSGWRCDTESHRTAKTKPQGQSFFAVFLWRHQRK